MVMVAMRITVVMTIMTMLTPQSIKNMLKKRRTKKRKLQLNKIACRPANQVNHYLFTAN